MGDRTGNVLVMAFLMGIVVGICYGLSGEAGETGNPTGDSGTGSVAYVWDIAEFDL